MEPEIAGRYMGFDLQILDNDGSGREAAMAWNNNEHEAYFNPSKMGTVQFNSEIITNSFTAVSRHYSLYPNPVEDILVLESDISISTIRIISVDGRFISEANCDQSFSQRLDLSQLKKGLYFIEIIGESDQKEIFKFIKE
jgi:hypothetical protein